MKGGRAFALRTISALTYALAATAILWATLAIDRARAQGAGELTPANAARLREEARQRCAARADRLGMRGAVRPQFVFECAAGERLDRRRAALLRQQAHQRCAARADRLGMRGAVRPQFIFECVAGEKLDRRRAARKK